MPPVPRLHVLNVGPDGTFRRSGSYQSHASDIDDLISHLEQQRAPHVALHFHGGLISEKAGLEIAAKLIPVYQSAGTHPLALVWETGLLETVSNNLTTIHRTKLFQKLLRIAIRIAVKYIGGEVGRGPGTSLSFDDIEAELGKERPFEAIDAPGSGARGAAARLSDADIEANLPEIEHDIEVELEVEADELEQLIRDEAPRTELLDPSVAEALKAEVDRGRGPLALAQLAKMAAKVVARVSLRFVRKRDHGFYPTLVEELVREFYLADLGAWVWSGMKNAGEAMWLPNDGLAGDGLHAGSYLLDGLARLQVRHPEISIDLVGHSAGSIAICRMLDAAAQRHPSLHFRNVVFLAPACRSDLFLQEVVERPGRYERFRMFTMSDAYESDDTLVPGVYTRSLLYFVSGVLEDEVDCPIAGLERYLSGEEPYQGPPLLRIQEFLHADAQDRLVLSKNDTAAAGLRSTAVRHGDFDDDALTLESLKHLLSE